MRLYLAGPMRGRPELNYPAFAKAASLLRADGHEVFCPPEYDATLGLDASVFDGLREALAVDLTWICKQAEGLVVLPDWRKSLGATAEVATANALDLPVWELGEFIVHGTDAWPLTRGES